MMTPAASPRNRSCQKGWAWQGGLYLFGISLTGNDPIDATGQLVFDLGSVSTGVYTGNPSAGAESTFDDLQTDADGGLYEITLTGVSVPEPATSATLCDRAPLSWSRT